MDIDTGPWARMREMVKSPEEIAAREATMRRLQRQGHSVGEALAALVEWPAIQHPAPMVDDALASEGLAWARSVAPGYPGALLWGPAGTGKTTLCCHALSRLQADGWTVALVSTASLLRACLADRWGKGRALLAEVAKVDVLVLDDLGAGTWERGWAGWLFEVMDVRWKGRGRDGAMTIATTNADPLKATFLGWDVQGTEDKANWERVVDRLRVLCPRLIEYAGPSRRT